MPIIRLTKRSIDAIPLTERGQVLDRDDQLPGFGLRVGTQSKVFFVEGQVGRRTRRVTVGRYGPLSPEQARKLALRLLGNMAQGVDPNAKKRAVQARSVTLAQAFERFFAAKPNLSPRTLPNYRRTVKLYLADWADRPIASISRQMVLQRHQRIAAEHGAVTANNVVRHLRSIYNFVASTHDDMGPNPVEILSQARSWYPERRRRRLIQSHQLADWFEAVMAEPPHARDFLLVALLTGMRRREIATLRWEHIDLRGRILRVPSTRNGDPLELPLSSHLARVLMSAKLRASNTPWAFPSRSASGHVSETKSFVARVGKRCGVEFSLHDLRRTFITIAESLDIPAYALKRLLNHRSDTDVTGGYIVIDVERLRAPVERIANRIWELANGAGREASRYDAA